MTEKPEMVCCPFSLHQVEEDGEWRVEISQHAIDMLRKHPEHAADFWAMVNKLRNALEEYDDPEEAMRACGGIRCDREDG